MKKILIKLNKKQHTLTVEADGYVGTGCATAVQDILAAAKQSAQAVEEKPEYYQQEQEIQYE